MTAPFHLVEDAPALIDAVNHVGYPAFVKSCEQGYDGQNQWHLRDDAALDALAAKMPTLRRSWSRVPCTLIVNCH